MPGYPRYDIDWARPFDETRRGVEVQIDRYYREMEGKTLDLDAEPLREGVDALQRKVAEAVAISNRLTDIAHELARMECDVTRRAKSCRRVYEMSYQSARADPTLEGKDAVARDNAAKLRCSIENQNAAQWEDLSYLVKTCREVARDRIENMHKSHEGLSKQISLANLQAKAGV